MNSWNRLLGVVMALAFIFFASWNASAQTVSLMSTQDFSSGQPSGWSNDGSWYTSSNGNGGSNGSMYVDMWDYWYSNDVLTTSSVDASSYGKDQDSVWLDFDMCWQYNYYDAYYGEDNFGILANNDKIWDEAASQAYTYNTNDYSIDYDPPTDQADWVHYHLLIPVADRSSQLTITFQGEPNYGCSNPAIDNVEITAFSLPPGEFSLLPKSLNFGIATPNAPDTLCVTAYSVGAVPVHIVNYGITGSTAYSVIGGPAIGDSIMPGNSAQYCIQFQPLNTGTLIGSFSLSTDAPDSATQTVSLTGVGAVPEVSYNGVTNLFRHVATMLSDTSQTVYLPVTSTGIAPLNFNSIYFIGLNANDYIVTRMPQNPLPGGVTDSIGIQFVPTIEGRPDASLVVSTNAQNIPLDTVSLFGVGILPHLVISVEPPGSGNTVMFDSVAIGDSVCQTITLTNPGTDTLQILKQLVTYGDYDFTYTSLAGMDTIILPGGGSQLATVCFKPLRSGDRFASIRFYTNIPRTFDKPSQDTSQFVVNVTGVGVPYGHLIVTGPFSDTAIVGTTNCISDTLMNNGQADITILSVTITGANDSAFVLSGITLPATLSPGQMQVVSLCFKPNARGTQFDTLTLAGSTSEKALMQSLLLQGVGAITCASSDSVAFFGLDSMTLVGATDTSCITVTNCGDVTAVYTASAGTGTGYTLLPPLTSAPVPAGNTAEFCVAYTPTALGSSSGTVTITGGPANLTTRLAGVGAGVIASASGVPSGAVTLGMCDTFSVFVQNTGNVAWTPGTAHISGADSADFTVQSGPMPAVIPPGGIATVVINFCPKVNGPEPMTLVFPAAAPMPITAFSYNVTAMGTTEGVTIRTEENGFSLGQSYPNPTNGTADIPVTLPGASNVRIDLLNAMGEVVRTAFTGMLGAGEQSVAIDAKGLPSGTYYYMLTSGNIQLTRQLSLIK